MPSPDFSQYVDLTIYDKEPGQIYLDAIEYAQSVALPEFNPRAGSVEDALLQAIAYATSELTGAINRLPDGLLEGILNLYGFTRQQSVSARLTVGITLVDDSGGTIPTGALFSYTTEGENGLETFFFSTVNDLTIMPGFTTGDVEAEALSVGVIPTIDSGTDLTLVSGVSRVISAETVGNMIQGEDEESDISYFTRAAAFLASRSNSLATSVQIQNYLTTYLNEIQRSYVSDLTYFRYMRVESVQRTDDVVRATVTGLGNTWTTPNNTITFMPDDITVGVDRVIVRYVNDSGTFKKINGSAATGTQYIIEYSSYSPSAGTFTIEFRTDTSADVAVDYFPSSSAPHNEHDITQFALPTDHYIEILLVPNDYNEHPGSVGLVFGNSNGLPIQNTAYTNVQNAVAEKSVAGLKFTAIAPLLVPITVAVEIEHAPTFGAVAVRQAVETALEQYLSPANWVFGRNIYVNTLIGVAAGVTGVARIASLTLSIVTSDFDGLAQYLTDDGGFVQFAFPFCLPSPDVTVTGIGQ